MAGEINLHDLVAQERERRDRELQQELHDELLREREASEANKANWRILIAYEQEQQQAVQVAKKVAPLLLAAGVKPDVAFGEDTLVEQRRLLRRQRVLEQRTTAIGWLLNKSEGVAKPLHTEKNGYKWGAVLLTTGGLRAADVDSINYAQATKNGDLPRIVPATGSIPDIGKGSPVLALDMAWLNEDHILRIPPTENDMEDEEVKAAIAKVAIPCMARLLIDHGIELPPPGM